jgi:hypothetical protein
MSERREAVAKALHAVDVRLREEDGDFGVKTAPWDEAGDYTRGVFGEYADAAIAAIDATVPEQSGGLQAAIEAYREVCMRYGRIGATTAFTPTEHADIWIEIGDAERRIAAAIDATTTPPEPTDAEVEAAALAYEAAVKHPGPWAIYRFDDPYAAYKPNGFSFEAMRAALIAARNAGQGGS